MTLTAEQRALRAQGIGSSDIAAVCGLHPFRRPIDVWLEKIGETPEREATVQTRMGELLEAQIAAFYAEVRGVTLTRSTTQVGAESWMVATPDYDRGDDMHVECKNVGYRLMHHWPEGVGDAPRQMPDYVFVQCQWQAEITGRALVDVAALIGGRDFVISPVKHSPKLAADLVEIGREFWKSYVLPKRPPTPDGSEAYAKFLSRRHPDVIAEPLKATPADEELADELRAADKAWREADERYDKLANQFKARMGDAGKLLGSRWSISWHEVKEGIVPSYSRARYRAFKFTDREATK